jgi:hypothetical protein
MVTRIDNYPISSGLVVLSITTAVINTAPATVVVTLVTREELLPTAVAYIEAQNLVPEIISRAGLDEEIQFTTVIEESHTTASNGNHTYKMQLDATNS